MKKILCAVILGMFMTKVNALTFLGAGTVSCGTYLKEKESSEIAHSASMHWFLGFLSALGTVSGKDLLKNTDYHAIEAAVTKYCQENPLDDGIGAALNVGSQLQKRMR